MGPVVVIVRKDLVLRLRDRTLLLYGFVAPLVLAVVLGATFGGVEDNLALDLVVVDAGAPDLVAPFVEEVVQPLVGDGLVMDVMTTADEAAARADVAAGMHSAAVVVRAGTLEVVGAADSPTAAAVTEAIASAYAERVRVVGTTVTAGAATGAAPQDLTAAARSAEPVLSLVDAPVGVQPIDLTTYTAAGMAVFFLLFSVGIAVTGLLEEERDGTLDRLRAAPVPGWAPLVAKAATAVLVGLASMGSLVVATTLLTGARWGAWTAVVPLVVAAVLAATGVAALVASRSRTPEVAGSVMGVVGTVLGALGGAFFPLRDVGLLAVLRNATPHHWFLRGLTRTAGGAPTSDVLDEVLVLLGIAAVAGVLAIDGLRRRGEV